MAQLGVTAALAVSVIPKLSSSHISTIKRQRGSGLPTSNLEASSGQILHSSRMEAKLEYLADIELWNHEKPYRIFFDIGKDVKNTNCQFEAHDRVQIKDVRLSIGDYHLDKDGFELVRTSYQKNLSSKAFEDPEQLDSVVVPYLQGTLEYLKDSLSAEQVICVDWRFRAQGREVKNLQELEDLTNIRNEALQPAKYVHVDFSQAGGSLRLNQHLRKEELQKYDGKSWKIQIINVWRPLVPVVHNFPLAFCHPDSVEAADLIEKDNITNTHTNVATLYLLYRPYHRWCYVDQQVTDEAWVFVSWDRDQKSCCPPHVAFELTNQPENAVPRESVEARFVVIRKVD